MHTRYKSWCLDIVSHICCIKYFRFLFENFHQIDFFSDLFVLFCIDFVIIWSRHTYTARWMHSKHKTQHGGFWFQRIQWNKIKIHHSFLFSMNFTFRLILRSFHFLYFYVSSSFTQRIHRFFIAILRYFQLFTLWSWLPVRITMYQPVLLYTTEEHGCSLTTFYVRVEMHEPTLLMIKTCNNEVSYTNIKLYLKDAMCSKVA